MGGDLWLRHPEALEFIEDCRQMGLVIVGMDFYEEVDGGFVPLLSSADYSSISQRPDAVERGAAAATRLIAGGLPNGASWVSFVVSE